MPGQKIRHDTLLAALALTFTVHGHAAEGETPAMPVVQVAGHYNNAIGSSDAASQGSITADLIASRPALRTGELLEFVPGMIVTQHSGDGKANQYFLRGHNLDHGTDFATFVDGMPVNMRTHAHGQGYSDLNFLIPELVKRIDYVKGPSFADEGDFASAGAAHIRLADKLAARPGEPVAGQLWLSARRAGRLPGGRRRHPVVRTGDQPQRRPVGQSGTAAQVQRHAAL
jgi:outer membrane receptor protein involved in Fe transport